MEEDPEWIPPGGVDRGGEQRASLGAPGSAHRGAQLGGTGEEDHCEFMAMGPRLRGGFSSQLFLTLRTPPWAGLRVQPACNAGTQRHRASPGVGGPSNPAYWRTEGWSLSHHEETKSRQVWGRGQSLSCQSPPLNSLPCQRASGTDSDSSSGEYSGTSLDGAEMRGPPADP